MAIKIGGRKSMNTTTKHSNRFGSAEKIRGLAFSWLAVAVVTVSALPAQAATPVDTEFLHACKTYSSGKLLAAQDQFIEILCKKPNYWPAHYQLGNTYMSMNKMLEASIEYERCLEMTKDPNTRKNCLQALSYISSRSGISVSKEAEDQVAAFDASMAGAGAERIAEAHLAAQKEKAALLAKGRVKAAHIRKQAKEQAAELVSNSNFYRVDPEMNLRPFAYPPGSERAITEAADARAAAVLGAAEAAANEVAPPTQDDTTESLRSQMRTNARSSSVRLSPVGTGVYVRSYTSVNSGKVAAKSAQSVK